MPQVDLSSVCVGDIKVSCETLSNDDYPQPAPVKTPPAVIDYAPESFWLSKDAELDWLDRNTFIERKHSAKGSNSNPNQYLNPNSNLNSLSGSQRYSVNIKSKPSIIGLPKPRQTNFDAKNQRSCKLANIRLFPKPSGSGWSKPAAALSEPSSPKVSCMGRVRSRKDSGKNRKNKDKPELSKSRSRKGGKTGFWNNLKGMFGSKGNKMGYKRVLTAVESVGVVNNSTRAELEIMGLKKKRDFNFNNSTTSIPADMNPVELPGLRGVKRFASARRSDAWAANLEISGTQSEPLDQGPIWRRRERVPPEDVNVADRE